MKKYIIDILITIGFFSSAALMFFLEKESQMQRAEIFFTVAFGLISLGYTYNAVQERKIQIVPKKDPFDKKGIIWITVFTLIILGSIIFHIIDHDFRWSDLWQSFFLMFYLVEKTFDHIAYKKTQGCIQSPRNIENEGM